VIGLSCTKPSSGCQHIVFFASDQCYGLSLLIAIFNIHSLGVCNSSALGSDSATVQFEQHPVTAQLA
jgi:hypothetical protein